jgi:maltooligosyltrehalose trehalohydrolase
MSRSWPLHGARALAAGEAEYRVWAPAAAKAAVRVGGRAHPMRRSPDGMWETVAPAGDYLFAVDGREFADPASRHQPAGTRGASRVFDPAFAWTDAAWTGLELEDHVIYELHVGTFTPEGTFDAAIGRLAALRELGVTAVELMPAAEFPGSRNWGYDGVFLYAAHSGYGGPRALQRFVDACHRVGLAAILDVVYNHIGPEDSVLEALAPYGSTRFDTPWGRAFDYDRPEVRRFVVDNALMWLIDFHFDGLRLDAAHALFDTSDRHIVSELAEAFRVEAHRRGRRAWVYAETDENDVRLIEERGVDSHWNDDFHHAMHALLTGSNRGYFVDYGRMADLAKAIEEGFVLDGTRPSTYRGGRPHGSSSRFCRGRQFVAFLQNHDQIANGSQGRRQTEQVSAGAHRAAAAVWACAPNVPLLFMGQEYAEAAPFHYFVDHRDPGLVDAVRRGRRREFERFGFTEEFPDPAAPATFEACKLDWSRRDRPGHAAALRLYRDLLSLRRRTPELSNCRRDLARVRFDEAGRWLALERGDPGGGAAVVAANLGGAAREVPLPPGSWRVALWTEDARYGGSGPSAPQAATARLALPAWSAAALLRV